MCTITYICMCVCVYVCMCVFVGFCWFVCTVTGSVECTPTMTCYPRDYSTSPVYTFITVFVVRLCVCIVNLLYCGDISAICVYFNWQCIVYSNNDLLSLELLHITEINSSQSTTPPDLENTKRKSAFDMN